MIMVAGSQYACATVCSRESRHVVATLLRELAACTQQREHCSYLPFGCSKSCMPPVKQCSKVLAGILSTAILDNSCL
jgi:hypothetical protein